MTVALSLCAMMVTRAEAEQGAFVEQAVKDTKTKVEGADFSRRTVQEILARADGLEPSERRLVVIELAIALWLRSLAPRGPLYPGFEAFLRSSLSSNGCIEQHVRPLIGTGRIYDDAVTLYSDYLQGMFKASGKIREQFYGEMLAEIGLPASLDDVDFGEKAKSFFMAVVGTVHEDHLLVHYSTKLVLRLYMTTPSYKSVPVTDEKLDLVYKYFERGIPLGDDFLDYTEDEVFLRHSLEHGDLAEVE